MNDDVKEMILQSLARIEGKLDTQVAELSSNGQRLAVLEAKAAAQEKINTQVETLAKAVDQGYGAKGVVAWIITTAVALIGWFK